MRRTGWKWRATVVALVSVWVAAPRGSAFGQEAPIGEGVVERPAVERGGDELTLERAIQEALESNRELESARHQLVGAEAQVREAWSAVYPTVNANASYTRNIDVPVQFLPAVIFDPSAGEGEMMPVRFGQDNSWFGQLRLEQPIFQAGVFIGLGAAERYRRLQGEVVRGQEQQIVTRTKRRYFDVLLAEEAVRLNEESVRRVRESLEDTRAMNRAGLVGDYDVLRLEVELANLEPALRRSNNGAEAARRDLAIELGMQDATSIRVAGSLAGVDVTADGEPADVLSRSFAAPAGPSAALEPLIELAHRNRSDLRQVRLTEDLRRTELRAEQAEYLPRISFFASYAYSAQADGGINPFGWGGNSATTPTAGIQVTIPLFNGFRRPARTEQMRAGLRQVQAEGELAVAQVENQVETLFDQVVEARLRAEAQRVAVEQARRGYQIASAQFREGLGTRLELTDAEVALRQSEFNLAQAVHDYLNARAQLDQAVGVVPETM